MQIPFQTTWLITRMRFRKHCLFIFTHRLIHLTCAIHRPRPYTNLPLSQFCRQSAIYEFAKCFNCRQSAIHEFAKCISILLASGLLIHSCIQPLLFNSFSTKFGLLCPMHYMIGRWWSHHGRTMMAPTTQSNPRMAVHPHWGGPPSEWAPSWSDSLCASRATDFHRERRLDAKIWTPMAPCRECLVHIDNKYAVRITDFSPWFRPGRTYTNLPSNESKSNRPFHDLIRIDQFAKITNSK